jgi:hypothetical protein
MKSAGGAEPTTEHKITTDEIGNNKMMKGAAFTCFAGAEPHGRRGTPKPERETRDGEKHQAKQ